MEDKRCETCKWWTCGTDDEWDHSDEPDWGNCDMAFVIDSRRRHENTKAVSNSVAGMNFLMTREDFGCVQWESSE